MKAKIMIPVCTILIITTFIFLAPTTKANESLNLMSPAFADGEKLPAQFTCEGDGISPPLNWSGVPEGTESLVMIMDHMPAHKPEGEIANNDENTPPPPPRSETTDTEPKPEKPEGVRWYWTMYNIPAHITAIDSGIVSNSTSEQSTGILGTNIVNDKNEYAPPCSKGPGLKNYTFHLYALSATLDLTESENISEATLRENIHGLVLDSDSLTVNFERSCRSALKPRSEKDHSEKEHPKHSPKPRPEHNSQKHDKRDPPPALPLCEKTSRITTSVTIENT